MKKISILLPLMAILLYACNDEFLERSPGTNISDADYWKTPNDLKMYTNNYYNNFLPAYSGWGTVGIYGQDGDDGTDTQIGGSFNTVINGERVVPAAGGGWSADNWTSLRNVNYFMANYTRVDIPFGEIKPYLGETLFFRAYFYFSKLKQFGDVPYLTTPLGVDSEQLFAERTPRNIVADSLIADLDKAIDYLPGRGTWTGRLTKEVALMLQSQIALFEGTWEKYHAGTPFGVQGSNGTKYLQKAAEASKKLIDLGTCALENPDGTDPAGYTKLFNRNDYATIKEVIFWRKYSVPDNMYHVWARYTGGGAGRGVTKTLVDSYLCIDGKPIANNPNYKGDATLKDVVANRDPRLVQTICVNDNEHLLWKNETDTKFIYPAFDGGAEGRSVTGYQLYKGHNPDYAQFESSKSITGLIYYRYAEALLNLAEAKAELGTLTQADVDATINLLRKRVGMPGLVIDAITPDPNWQFPALSPIINEVRRERMIELACEGYRLDDIYRWAAADELIVGKRPKGARKAQWNNVVAEAQATNNPDAVTAAEAVAKALTGTDYTTDANGYIDPYAGKGAVANGYKFNINRDYLWPLPISEMTLNPKLKQNPGW